MAKIVTPKNKKTCDAMLAEIEANSEIERAAAIEDSK